MGSKITILILTAVQKATSNYLCKNRLQEKLTLVKVLSVVQCTGRKGYCLITCYK